jgi:uncharacterized protein YecE (DUF72 family)
MPELRIGCSGFSYPHWRGTFYPPDLPAGRWLEYYCTVFRTVELNVTFYRLPGPSAFDAWYAGTPPDFSFALKGSRFITHVKKLLDPAEPLKLFFANANRLREKLEAVLWQLPPGVRANADRLAAFLLALRKYPVRHVFEFRHESWASDEITALCSEHNACLCKADWPAFLDAAPLTADFVYIRRHGQGGDYATGYTKRQLEKDASRIRRYREGGRDVFVYFNNDAFGNAPRNARELQAMTT